MFFLTRPYKGGHKRPWFLTNLHITHLGCWDNFIKFQSGGILEDRLIHATNCVCRSLDYMNLIASICFLHFENQSYPIYTNTPSQKQPPARHPLLSAIWAAIEGEYQPSWSGVDQTRSLWTRRRGKMPFQKDMAFKRKEVSASVGFGWFFFATFQCIPYVLAQSPSISHTRK